MRLRSCQSCPIGLRMLSAWYVPRVTNDHMITQCPLGTTPAFHASLRWLRQGMDPRGGASYSLHRATRRASWSLDWSPSRRDWATWLGSAWMKPLVAHSLTSGANASLF